MLKPVSQPKDLEIRLPPMRLHLDDIQAIYDQLSDLGQVGLVADSYEAESPADLAKLPEEDAREVSVVVAARQVLIKLTRENTSHISAKDVSHDVRGVLTVVEAGLRSRRRRLVALLLRRWLGIWLFAAVELPFLLDQTGWLRAIAARTIGVCVAAAATPALVLRMFYFGDRATRITTRRRRDVPGFWRRKREDIAINVFCVLVGIGAGALLPH